MRCGPYRKGQRAFRSLAKHFRLKSAPMASLLAGSTAINISLCGVYKCRGDTGNCATTRSLFWHDFRPRPPLRELVSNKVCFMERSHRFVILGFCFCLFRRLDANLAKMDDVMETLVSKGGRGG